MLRTLLAMMGSGRLVVNINVGAQNNYVANTAKVTGYVAGNTDVTFTLTGLVGSASTGSYAFDVDTSWAAGDTVKVVNSASYIQGRGGAAASAGGPALRAQRACSVDNTGGTIAGGGGGGGTGGSSQVHGAEASGYPLTCNTTSPTAGGGNGGTGAGSQGSASGGSAGATSSLSGAPDCGCANTGSATGGTGGSGGSLGSAGATGGTGSTSGGGFYNGYGWTCPDPSPVTNAGSAGGAAGAAVNGNSNITWIATGTRLGGIS